MAILTELQDPRVKNVTVTLVEVAPDLRTAKVHVSVRGDETCQRLSLRGLQSSAGFLQKLVAKRIDTRYTPILTFVLDQGVKRSLEVASILREVLPSEETEGDDNLEEWSDEDLHDTHDEAAEDDAADESDSDSPPADSSRPLDPPSSSAPSES